VHSDGTSLLFSLSFSITRCVRCASIRPAIKRYISSLAIDFRAPSPSLLLRSLRARRNPLRQLTFRLPPHDADLLASRRRRLTRFALGPLRAKPFPTIARPARRDATHFRRPMGAISLSLSSRSTRRKVRLSRSVGRLRAMPDAKFCIDYLPRSENLSVLERDFFISSQRILEKTILDRLTYESVTAALVRRLPRNDKDKDSRGKIHIETARKAAIVQFTTRYVLREKSIRRGYFVSTLQRTGAKSAPVRN